MSQLWKVTFLAAVYRTVLADLHMEIITLGDFSPWFCFLQEEMTLIKSNWL